MTTRSVPLFQQGIIRCYKCGATIRYGQSYSITEHSMLNEANPVYRATHSKCPKRDAAIVDESNLLSKSMPGSEQI